MIMGKIPFEDKRTPQKSPGFLKKLFNGKQRKMPVLETLVDGNNFYKGVPCASDRDYSGLMGMQVTTPGEWKQMWDYVGHPMPFQFPTDKSMIAQFEVRTTTDRTFDIAETKIEVRDDGYHTHHRVEEALKDGKDAFSLFWVVLYPANGLSHNAKYDYETLLPPPPVDYSKASVVNNNGEDLGQIKTTRTRQKNLWETSNM